jgi:serine/threonine-protein kinase HipA
MSVIGYFRISLDRARRILSEVERAVSSWRDHGRALGMTDGELDAFADAFEHPERDAVRRASAR